MPNVTQKLINDHLVDESAGTGEPIALRVDQTLTQDATGTLVMLELAAMGLDRVRTELSVQYVDHNLVQVDHRNPDDHLFLQSACQRFGLWFSRPGNGVSHPVHQEHFGRPGKTLLGSDSHTPAAGAIGMLAFGAGGVDVALAMAGEPYRTRMPEVWGVRLEGTLPRWVSAKDVILEMLRRHDVKGGLGRVVEYHGPGLASLSVWDRHVIANMGAELGATSTVFPSDGEVRRFLRQMGREDQWVALEADPDAGYDVEEEIDLSTLEPLIAMPTSPGNVRPVREVAGEPIYQAYIGSSANPGFRDFAIAAEMVRGRQLHERVSLDINPTTRGVLRALAEQGLLAQLVAAGGRLHQTGCNGCIGMGQAPATGRISLRTVPRNFPGRSGTREDRVCLVSPETAAASALTGVITDPRELDLPYPVIAEPGDGQRERRLFVPPSVEEERVELVMGPNIKDLPELEPLPDALRLPVLLKVGDNISTDEILPAGTRALPLRSNIPAISQFAFEAVDPEYAARATETRADGGHAVVGGRNYGQGSSREHAVLAPRHLGLRVVLARSFARIHRQNLPNFGVLPLELAEADHAALETGHVLQLSGLRDALRRGQEVEVTDETSGRAFTARHGLTEHELELVLAGGVINHMRARLGTG